MNNKDKESNPFSSLYLVGTHKPQCNIELIDNEIEISGKIIKSKKTIIKSLNSDNQD